MRFSCKALVLAIGFARAFSPINYDTRTSVRVNAGGTFIEEPIGPEAKENLGPDPKYDFKNWLKSKKAPVHYRKGTTGNLLVSGNRLIDQFMNQKGNKGPTFVEPELLYMLMEEHYKFDFDKIYVCAYDIDDAKKRFISRKARYTGLLGKLEFIESDHEWDEEHPEIFSIPTAEQFKKYGITNWIYMQDEDHVFLTEKAFDVAKESRSQLNNVVMTMMDYYEDEDVTIPLLNNTWNTLGGNRHNRFLQPDLKSEERYLPDDVQYTFLVCATPTSEPEGSPTWYHDDILFSSQEERRLSDEQGYSMSDIGVLENTDYKGARIARHWDRISQSQMFRFTADALDLACMSGRAFHFYEAWDPILKRYQKPLRDTLVGMRESAFTSTECLSYIIDNDLDIIYKRDEKVYRYSDGYEGKLTKNWWDDPIYKKSKLIDPEPEEPPKTPDELRIEEVAREVGERRYYKAVVSGQLDKDTITCDDYIKKNWDSCMEEGAERYWKVAKTYDFEKNLDEREQRMLEVYEQRAAQGMADVLQEVSPKIAEAIKTDNSTNFVKAIREERYRLLGDDIDDKVEEKKDDDFDDDDNDYDE